MRWRCFSGDFSWLCSCGRSTLFIDWGGVAPAGADLFKFEAGVTDPQDTVSAEQGVAFADNEDLLSVAEEGALGGAVGHRAVTKEFHVGRQARRRFDYYRLRRGVRDTVGHFRTRRGRQSLAE